MQGAEVNIVYADASFAALAANLRQALLERGWRNVSAEPFEQQAPAAQALFYLGKASGFSRLTEALQQAGRTPYLFASSNQVASELLLVPPAWSRRVFLAYPFIPGDWTAQGRAALTAMRQRQGLDGRQGLLQVSTWCAMQLLEEALKRAGRDASREKLTQALEGLHDVQTGLTPALGFGPGRRQGLNGAHVVTVEMPGPVFYPVAAYQSVLETRSP
ncbi:hypothetical protein D3C76_1157700 [compost metagenome]